MPPVAQLLKNSPKFCGTRCIITMLTRALYWFLSWVRWIQSIPHHSILIVSFCLRLGLPSGLVLSVFPAKSCTYTLSFHACFIPCSSRPPWLHHSNYIWRKVQFMKLLIMQFSPTSYHFIPLRSKYSPQTPPVCLLPSLNVTDKYKTKAKFPFSFLTKLVRSV
jgi:hypothetical protein